MTAHDQVQPLNATEQVRYEGQVRMRYAYIAAVAGVLLVLQAVLQVVGPHASVSELTLDLIVAHRRFPLDLIGACIDCGGLIALALMLVWLHSIARARNPGYRDFIRWMIIGGAALSGVLAIVYSIVIVIKANQFVAHGTQSYVEANALTKGGVVTIVPLLAQLGSLLLAAGFIWTAVNAMRVGLVTRFMGYLGAFAGLLVIFPIGSPVPVVQGFWLLAMAVLFAGRWPSGELAAWKQGVAVPWPPMSQPRERPQRGAPRQRGSRQQIEAARGQGKNGPAPAPAPASAPAAAATDDAASSRTRATTPKRKRKRRR